jgi:alanine-glyoxylate transaminase/serine-glyoxylate transaminase/serine-pyruvate transaminase
MTHPPRIPGRRHLHSPGPSPLPDAVLHALALQPMDLADPRVDANIAACEAGLRRLLDSAAADIFFYACNGHGVWEAAVENLLPPGAVALIPATGHFSEQWAIQVEALGRRALRTPWREGWPIDAAAVAQALRDDPGREIAAVFAVHTDTASGITSDLAALRAAIDASGHPALFVVDAVASVGVEALAMDALRIDAVLGASQKGLMCPPGLGFLALGERAFDAAQRNPAPRFYWDVVRRKSDVSYRKFCGTPPQNLMFALEAALGLIEAEGAAAARARHARLAGAVRAAVQGWAEGGALGLFALDAATRANAVTTVAVPPSLQVDELRAVARERFQVAIAGGLGPLAGRAFRIGHLGDQNEANVLGALAGVEAALRVLGVPVDDGIGRAVAALAEAAAPQLHRPE